MLLKPWDDLPDFMRTEEVRVYYDVLKKHSLSLALKRIFDFTVSLILLVIIWPILLILAVGVKLDSPGPAFYKQERVTTYGKRFRIWKFRTMVANADKIGTQVTVSNDKIPAGSEKLAIAAGIIAYFNSKNCTVSGCANTGEIVNNAANGAVNECLSLFFNKNADGCAAENNSCKEIPGVTVYEVNGTVPASYKFITEAPEPVPTPVTADGVVWFVFAAVVAIIGMALAVRERKAD